MLALLLLDWDLGLLKSALIRIRLKIFDLLRRYVAVCGPMEYSSIRLNLSQAFNGIGKIVGPLIASDTFFRKGNGDDLSSIQWVFFHGLLMLILTGLSGNHSIRLVFSYSLLLFPNP